MALGVEARRKEEVTRGRWKTESKVDNPLLGLGRSSAAPSAHIVSTGARVLRDVRDILGDAGRQRVGLAAQYNDARVRPEREGT